VAQVGPQDQAGRVVFHFVCCIRDRQHFYVPAQPEVGGRLQVELIVALVFTSIVTVALSRMHARTMKKEIETNENVLNHRLEIRRLDDAKEAREQKLLGDGSGK
jgi:hypothetical protein